MKRSRPHLVTHGQQPLIIPRFAIPIYFTGHEILNLLRQTLGWSVLVRVDNQTYLFLGDVDPNLINGTVNSTNIMVRPSSTILSGLAGPMRVNLTFLNPIEVRSRSFVKFNVYICIIFSPEIGSSNPSRSRICLSPQTHRTAQVIMCRCIQTSVEVLAVILRSPSSLLSFTTEWMSGNRTQKMMWNTTFDSFSIFHNVTLQTSAMYTEILDQPEWGSLYFATPSVSFRLFSCFHPFTAYDAGNPCQFPKRIGC